ncbi:MAG: (2Fe-2S) ferredoxin domain-containing protein [Spirochaetes bacterium]|nr:(2Fe-2S) ferredoxin domain-containing protein [Spirochaetota bacterium]
MDLEKIVIEVCMGSSCFSRGNKRNLEILQDYIRKEHLDGTVDVRGKLCAGSCKKGPTITINGNLYSGVTPSLLKTLLQTLSDRKGLGHG